MSKIPLWGQFLPRPSVVLVVIFCLGSPTLEEKPFSSCLIRDDQWLKSTTSLVNHWSSFIRHEEEGFPSNVGLSKSKMTTSKA